MATTIDKISYAGTAVSLMNTTLTSLTSASNIGVKSTVVDNTTNLYDDVLIHCQFKTAGTVTMANDKAVYVYVYGAIDGASPLFDGSSAEAQGTEGTCTLDAPTNMKGPIVVAMPSSAVTYRKTFNLSSFFGGVMPAKWGICVVNACSNSAGAVLSATLGDSTVTYTGIYYTNA